MHLRMYRTIAFSGTPVAASSIALLTISQSLARLAITSSGVGNHNFNSSLKNFIQTNFGFRFAF